MSFRERIKEPSTAIVHDWSYSTSADWGATTVTLPAGGELRFSGGGLYLGAHFGWTGWAASDIIDLYARDLAMRRPA
jgi:hypothetical protein